MRPFGFGLFRICSGQSRTRWRGEGHVRADWGICLYVSCPAANWWRAKGPTGKLRLFRTPEAAERARLAMEKQGWPADLTARGIHQPEAQP